jgi:probable rRNA maturation factor
MNPHGPAPSDEPAHGAGTDRHDEDRIQVVGAGEDEAWLARMLEAAAGRVARPVRRVALRLVDEAEMIALHERFLGCAEPTDVLTFPRSAGPAEPLDVDIAVCLDVARAQAQRRGHPVAHEILLYAVHGILHEAGFDDHDARCAAAMHAEEDRILGAIGVGAVYGRGEEAP